MKGRDRQAGRGSLRGRVHPLAVVTALWLMVTPALAQQPNHGPVAPEATTITFSDGSTIEYFEWPSPDKLLIWAVNPAGAILWQVDLRSGLRTKVLTSTRVEELLGKGTDYYSVKFKLSPDGKKLALWRSPEAPLADPFFGILDLTDPERPMMEFANFSPAFQVGSFAWGPDSTYMYVAAAPYSGPENQFAIGRLSLTTKAFVGLVNRDQVDLIDELIFHPPSQSLIFVSQAIGLDYPLPPTRILGRVDLKSLSIEEIGRYPAIEDLAVDPVDDRLFFTTRPRDTDGDQRITSSDYTLALSYRFGDGAPNPFHNFTGLGMGLRRSPDGKYLAWMRIYDPLIRPPKMTDQADLWVERVSDGREYRVVAFAEDFRFAPDSSRLAVLVENHRKLLVFSLPKD